MKDINGFCCMNGDIMNYVESENGVLGCINKPFSWVAQEAHLPVWYLRGNHETRGCFARNLRDYLALKEGRYYGAATLGGVRFAFLDSGEDKPDRNGQYSGLVAFDRYLEAQNKWLEREVASPAWKKAQARIVFRHIPFPLRPLDSKGWKHKLPRLTDMDKILQGANVSLGLSAHIHFA
jgi:3',5'-cyclic AMP phosphodiesterase CpdA